MVQVGFVQLFVGGVLVGGDQLQWYVVDVEMWVYWFIQNVQVQVDMLCFGQVGEGFDQLVQVVEEIGLFWQLLCVEQVV